MLETAKNTTNFNGTIKFCVSFCGIGLCHFYGSHVPLGLWKVAKVIKSKQMINILISVLCAGKSRIISKQLIKL